jgi:hypothetical protein
MHGLVTIGTSTGAAELTVAAGAEGPMTASRAVLNAYGLVRLTTRADEYLGLALGLADGTGGDE